MNFDYTENTPIIIDNEKHFVRMFNGMSGIGSRKYWIDDKDQKNEVVMHTPHLTKGNHEIYTMKWRGDPWDIVDIIIHEDEVPLLLSKENEWREPVKRYFRKDGEG